MTWMHSGLRLRSGRRTVHKFAGAEPGWEVANQVLAATGASTLSSGATIAPHAEAWMNRTLAPLTLAAVLTVALASTVHAQSSLSADDVAEIHALYADYNLLLDAGNSRGWADTFTEDGTFNTSEGRAALIAFADNFHASNPNTRHWNSNIRITPTPEGAAGTAYLILWDVGARPQSISLTGTYQDTLVKTEDGWRFESRRVQIDRPAS